MLKTIFESFERAALDAHSPKSAGANQMRISVVSRTDCPFI